MAAFPEVAEADAARRLPPFVADEDDFAAMSFAHSAALASCCCVLAVVPAADAERRSPLFCVVAEAEAELCSAAMAAATSMFSIAMSGFFASSSIHVPVLE